MKHKWYKYKIITTLKKTYPKKLEQYLGIVCLHETKFPDTKQINISYFYSIQTETRINGRNTCNTHN